MVELFADRMATVKKSFIREILHFAADPKVISFAGGLPNPDLFPVEEIRRACDMVLDQDGRDALQYSTTEGYYPLREYIAERYAKKKGIRVEPDEILIITGSQQGVDLMGKAFLNRGDGVIIEKPGYLGAIQAFSLFMPAFHAIELNDNGIDLARLSDTMRGDRIKLFYTVSNFQNPSGISYSRDTREKVAEIFSGYDTILLEDDPYGELRFMGQDTPSFKNYLGEQAVLLGSFSKIVTPSFRLGWLCASRAVMEKVIIPKQACDLHTNYFCQRVIYRYLIDNDIDAHITKISKVYGRQRDRMVRMIEDHFPAEVEYTRPEGGMFLWLRLPVGLSSMDLLDECVKEQVAFVPGLPFYVGGGGENTIRLNYSNVDEDMIEEGMKRLARVIKKVLRGKK